MRVTCHPGRMIRRTITEYVSNQRSPVRPLSLVLDRKAPKQTKKGNRIQNRTIYATQNVKYSHIDPFLPCDGGGGGGGAGRMPPGVGSGDTLLPGLALSEAASSAVLLIGDRSRRDHMIKAEIAPS